MKDPYKETQPIKHEEPHEIYRETADSNFTTAYQDDTQKKSLFKQLNKTTDSY